MRINEMKLDNNLMSLLTELFSMKGAKEIFAKHNIEMVTEQIEKEGLANFIKQAKELFGTSKTVKEYNQAVQFLDLQINTNKSALAQAEGFMKTMIEGMITGFETTKNVAIQNFSPMFREELKALLHNIVNENDKEKIKKMIDKYDITKLDEMLELVKSIESSINSRYCETEREVDDNKSTNVSDIINDKEEKQVEKKSKSKKNESKEIENKKEEDEIEQLDLEDLEIPEPEQASLFDEPKEEKNNVDEIIESETIEIDDKELELPNDSDDEDPFSDEDFNNFLEDDNELFSDSDDGIDLDF